MPEWDWYMDMPGCIPGCVELTQSGILLGRTADIPRNDEVVRKLENYCNLNNKKLLSN